MTTHVMIHVPPELRARLEELAARDRRTLSGYCRMILEDAARKQQDRTQGSTQARG